MKYTWILLSLLFISWQQPSDALAGRPGAKILKEKSAKVFKAKAQKRNNNLRPTRKANFAKFRNSIKTTTRMRGGVRVQLKTAKKQRKNGLLSDAAKTLSIPRTGSGQFAKDPETSAFRERFALWRAGRQLKKTAFKQARKRSKVGDAEGARDALQSLQILEANGRLGMIGKFRTNRAKKKAFKNATKAANQALLMGDTGRANKNYQFASSLKPGSRGSKKAAKALIKASMKMAKSYAKEGRSSLAHEVLEMSAHISAEHGFKFDQIKALKVMEKAFKQSVPTLTKAAAKAYKHGDSGQAMQLLAEARAVMKSYHVKPSILTARKQQKLVQNLGPTLTQFENAQATH